MQFALDPDALPPAVAHHEGLTLIKLTTWVQASIDAVLAPEGLKTRHYSTLSVLRHKGPWAQHAVAEKLRIDKATMVSVINELEHRGLVGRERDPENKRCYRIWVTPAGSAWLEKAGQAISGVEDELFSPLSASSRRSLLALMNALFRDPTT